MCVTREYTNHIFKSRLRLCDENVGQKLVDRQVVYCHYLFTFQSLFCFQLNVSFQENN